MGRHKLTLGWRWLALVTVYDLVDLDRATADGLARGFVKVLNAPGKDCVLGGTIVGAHAPELLSECVLARKPGIALKKLLGTMLIYPTLREDDKYVAANSKRAHAPQRLLWCAAGLRCRKGRLLMDPYQRQRSVR